MLKRLVYGVGLFAYARLIAGRDPNGPVQRVFVWCYELYKAAVEAPGSRGLRRFLEPGAWAVDVGANIGFFSLRFGRWVSAGGGVVAIEPEAVNLAILERRLERSGCGDRVRVVRAAAGAKPGRGHLAINEGHPGDHRVADSGVEIDVVSLDQLASDLAIGRVGLVKIDVQGHEGGVLDGAAALIERDRPAILLEIDPEALAQNGESVESVLGRLTERGYGLYQLTRGGKVRALEAERAERLVRLEAGHYTDLLCLPPSAVSGRPAPSPSATAARP